jgi:hypothetical protein
MVMVSWEKQVYFLLYPTNRGEPDIIKFSVLIWWVLGHIIECGRGREKKNPTMALM